MRRPIPKRAKPRRFLRYHELKPVLGIPYSRVQLARLEAAGDFPKRTHLGVNFVAWFEHELIAWMDERARNRDRHAAQARQRGIPGNRARQEQRRTEGSAE